MDDQRVPIAGLRTRPSEAHLLLDGISGYARMGHAGPGATCWGSKGERAASRPWQRPVSGPLGDCQGSTVPILADCA